MLFTRSLLHLLPLVSLSSALPTEDTRGTLSRRNDSNSGIYYGVTGAEHEKRSKALKAGGYRVLSLSVFGAPPNVKYAAVWTKTAGAGFETIASADENTFNSWYESLKKKGYVSTHVSATGPADSAVFAGVMEEGNITEVQKCGMDSPYAYLNATLGLNMLVKGFSVYGLPSNRRYCVLGHENVKNWHQNAYYQSDAAPVDYQKVYNAEIQKRFWRPTYLDVTNDHLVSPLFEDTSAGKWESKVALSASQLKAEISAQKKRGLSLVQLQGGGNGDDVKYTAIFTEKTTTLPKKWHANGKITGFEDNKAVAAALDQAMYTWMDANGIRQAQVAISRNSKIFGERAFTLAESDRPVVKPDDKFLLGSVSKMFTHAAIQRLIDDGRITLSTKVYPLLGFKPVDERANDITIDHLVQHMGGYDRSKHGDVAFMFREVARSKNSSTPATIRDVIEYMVARPLDTAPGESYAYSNYGTMLLSYVVTNLTSTPYVEFLKKRVVEDGVQAELFATAAEKHVNDPVVQESRLTGLSPFFPQKEVLVPNTAGGEGDIKEEAVGAFALKASASSIAKFIGKNGKFESLTSCLDHVRTYMGSRS